MQFKTNKIMQFIEDIPHLFICKCQLLTEVVFDVKHI